MRSSLIRLGFERFPQVYEGDPGRDNLRTKTSNSISARHHFKGRLHHYKVLQFKLLSTLRLKTPGNDEIPHVGFEMPQPLKVTLC